MRAKQITALLTPGRSLALLIVGILVIGPLRAMAGSVIQEQTLTCGVQTMHGERGVNHGVGTTTATSAPILELWSYTVERPQVGQQAIIVTGTIEDTYADGQIFYWLQGTMVVHRIGQMNMQVITGTVRVFGGTGIFTGASGSGHAKSVVNWDGHFSSSIDATLRVPRGNQPAGE